MFMCKPEVDTKQQNVRMAEIKELLKRVDDELTNVVPATCAPAPPPPCITTCIVAPDVPPLCAPCIPILPRSEQEWAMARKVKPAPPPQPPDVMVCYKAGGRNKKAAVHRPRAKSRELRMGILYRGCDCEKLNGLQDDCRRTGCQGSPECLTKPDPICGPSEFSNGKHLGKKKMFEDEVDAETGEIITQYNCYPAQVTPIQ